MPFLPRVCDFENSTVHDSVIHTSRFVAYYASLLPLTLKDSVLLGSHLMGLRSQRSRVREVVQPLTKLESLRG